MYYNDALKKCESLNARLPLPRNKNESDAFMKIMGNGWGFAHADARNPIKTGNKKFWVDAEDKQIGNRDVYLWGLNKNDKIFCALLRNIFYHSK